MPADHPHGRRRGFAAVVALLLLAGCQHEGDGLNLSGAGAPGGPVTGKRHMVVAGHPLAADAGLEMLRRGGTAIDAAVAAAAVLSLVEPQSSGIGGGGFALHYDAKTGAIDAYDGRETAPRSAHAYMFLDGTGKPMDRDRAGIGGLGVGVPGLLRMLALAHADHGRMTWRDLFQPAIRLATDGFAIGERLARQIAAAPALKDDAEAAGYFYDAGGEPRTTGAVLVNPALAHTFKRIAEDGADALYGGDIAAAIVATATGAKNNPSAMTADDLAGYRAKKRPPVCLPYRAWLVCGMGPPSSGGIATLQILGILQGFDLAALATDKAKALHIVAEASNLAFADRAVYVADPDFVPVPAAGLLDPAYLALRAKEIAPAKAKSRHQPGMPGVGAHLRPPGDEGSSYSTSHLSVIDKDGSAVSLTASNAWTFGSRLMAAGFVLNNQLTDFSFTPNKQGGPVGNRAAAGKRPLSSMAPTLVFDGEGRVVMALGSAGGSRIIGYVAKTLIAALDWKLDARAAVDFPNFLARGGALEIEDGTALMDHAPALRKMGHAIEPFAFPSGTNVIRVTPDGMEGAADSRRDGAAASE